VTDTADRCVEQSKELSGLQVNDRDLSRAAGILIGIALRLINHQKCEGTSDDQDSGLRSRIDGGPD